MPIPTDPERRARWMEKCTAALRRGREPKYGCVCRHCGGEFLGRDTKSTICDACAESRPCAGGCGGSLTGRTTARYCKACSRKTPAVLAALERTHEATRVANPAKRPEVRAKISAAVKANHPSVLYPEQWAAHIAKYRPGKVSKVEDMVAPFLAGWERQHRVRWYALDFALPDRMLAVEVMGCWHHCCPKCFPGGPTHKTQKLVLRNDASKRSYLTSRGWTLVYIWEHEIRPDPAGAIERHVSHLQEMDQSLRVAPH